MLRAKELCYMDLHLKQVKYNNMPFDGVYVMLSGDPSQLSPVAGTSVLDYRNNLSNEIQNSCVLFRNV